MRPHPQVIDKMLSDPVLGKHLKKPSVSYGSQNLYAHGIYEVGALLHIGIHHGGLFLIVLSSLLSPPHLKAETRPNLSRAIGELVPESKALLTINDKALSAPMRVMLRYGCSMTS